MKKLNLLFVLKIGFMLLYIALMFTSFNRKYFSVAVLLIAAYTFVKFVIFKHDSKLFFSVFMASISFFVFKDISFYNAVNIFLLITFSFCLASFTIFVFFRQKFHLKVIVFCLFQMLLLYIYKNNFIFPKYYATVQIALIIILVYSLLKRVKINFRSKE